MCSITIPTEVTAGAHPLLVSRRCKSADIVTTACLLLTFWDKNLDHQPIYVAVIAIAMSLINIFGVRWFGECTSTSIVDTRLCQTTDTCFVSCS